MGIPLPPAARQQLVRRLARLEGQVAGVRAMVAAHRNAVAILTQIAAAQGALDAAAYALIDHHARHCLDCDDPGGPAAQAQLTELISAVEALLRHAPQPPHEGLAS